ncbi:MAG: hypothetical protein A3E32_02070 [Candidatus Zambryskibacteria bacterium RIFCSPHIGHO2_12_FULL_38_37]|uniref:Uncharacterized protein n=1 Tax=Candidatus Zambryskibacteria bacterium RIFCSPHIGHO2_12_FULL_38_37 TaxID=1802751 RepID=A0A1G2TR74_9BACT|nr:MAG: hypothetical protein A3E32_02070 [Candidatus Zambryskibacteria bacterium RIFCSPHIGHO2_12_FULL_38_37]
MMTDREMRELLELTRENNKLLHKMRRHAIIGSIMRLFYWTLILGGPIVLYYYFLQPYIDQLLEVYSGVQSGVDDVQKIGESVKSGEILKLFNIRQ